MLSEHTPDHFNTLCTESHFKTSSGFPHMRINFLPGLQGPGAHTSACLQTFEDFLPWGTLILLHVPSCAMRTFFRLLLSQEPGLFPLLWGSSILITILPQESSHPQHQIRFLFSFLLYNCIPFLGTPSSVYK